MATYAIGDVQGCYDELQSLLSSFQFDEQRDTLWFTGDLVNRGPQSLQTLEFVYRLPNKVVVLGNHDLHLLAVAAGVWTPHESDTFDEILQADDREKLLHWLCQQPLFHYDDTLNFCLVHAGLPPQWTCEQAIALATEVHQILKGDQVSDFLAHMYGNEPTCWSDDLSGWDRLRFITNAFTRMRYCTACGELDLVTSSNNAPAGFMPWFKVPQRRHQHEHICFGHWASLKAEVNEPQVYALDAGCVWGGQLMALRLEDLKRFSVPCQPYQKIS